MFIKELWDIVPDREARQYSSQVLISKLKESWSGARLRVLDLGCGDGKSIDWFKGCGLDVDWKGLDIEDSPEAKSRKRTDGEFRSYNGVDIPFDDSSFDVVFSNQVFEHVRHPETVLREICRVLCKGGIFMGSVSYLEPFHSYSLFNFTPLGWYTINVENGLTPTLLAGGIDALALIRRSLRFAEAGENIWTCSPLNKEIIEDDSLSIRAKNYKMLLSSGHMVFSSTKSEEVTASRVLEKSVEKRLDGLPAQIEGLLKEVERKSFKDQVVVQNGIYAQLEALAWLGRALSLSGSLPPLRGWAASPDVLLRLHEYVRFQKPKVVVECGSGCSTLVIADALRQNGEGTLVSLEHSRKYGAKTQALLEREGLEQWVKLRIDDLETWQGKHLNDGESEAVEWYHSASLAGIEGVDLLFVDGPPGRTCKFARYPALPALFDRLAPGAQIWMDDTIRQEEVDICNSWAEQYGYDVEFFALEKGLGVLIPNERNLSSSESSENKSSRNEP